MRNLILFSLLLIGFHSCAESSDRALTLSYNVDSVKPNSTLTPGKSEVIVFVKNDEFDAKQKILFGYDGEGFDGFLDQQRSFKFQLDSGEHVFQFYPERGRDYAEITTIPIHLESGTTSYLSVDFKLVVQERPALLKKPVIYLYPEEETNISVVVKPKGEMSFTYPAYDGKWECTAFPSGEILISDSDGYRNSYNYLFWEAEQTFAINELNQTEGKVVAKNDLMLFLESTLDEFGFTSKEKMDFITFWAPQMIQHEATEIRFIFNEECTFFADLEIEPKPDNLLRFYMIWNPTDASSVDAEMKLEIPRQIRSGFTVLEWGGSEIEQVDALRHSDSYRKSEASRH